MAPERTPPLSALSIHQRRALYRIAGHRYGWAYCGGWQERRSFEALLGKGLVMTSDQGESYVVTTPGREEIERRWPKSPLILGNYDRPAGGWDLLED